MTSHRHRGPACILAVAILLPGWARAGEVKDETSRVLRITVPKLAAGEAGLRRFDIYLREAGDNKGLTKGEVKQGVCIVVRCKGAEILNAWGYAGRINVVAHEVDPSGLNVSGDRLTGKAIVLFHDDQYYSLNFEQGTALAAAYTIDCRAAGEKTVGNHRGTIGVAWSRNGPAAGTVAPE